MPDDGQFGVGRLGYDTVNATFKGLEGELERLRELGLRTGGGLIVRREAFIHTTVE